jgi:hypothetical protein
MQWLLQDFDDTRKLADALDRLGYTYSWHKIIPFIGTFSPEPTITDPKNTIIFGSYAVWRTAEELGLWPDVFRVEPFLAQPV